MGGIRKARGAYNKSEGIRGVVTDRDVSLLREAMDNSKNTTKAEPDGMGKDSTEAIKEFLKSNKE